MAQSPGLVETLLARMSDRVDLPLITSNASPAPPNAPMKAPNPNNTPLDSKTLGLHDFLWDAEPPLLRHTTTHQPARSGFKRPSPNALHPCAAQDMFAAEDAAENVFRRQRKAARTAAFGNDSPRVLADNAATLQRVVAAEQKQEEDFLEELMYANAKIDDGACSVVRNLSNEL